MLIMLYKSTIHEFVKVILYKLKQQTFKGLNVNPFSLLNKEDTYNTLILTETTDSSLS